MMQIVGALAEFERAMLGERTGTGLEAPRRDGRIDGRRPELTPLEQVGIVRMVSRGTKTAVTQNPKSKPRIS
jgi:DNA invertase Pin-like site-specific DNA recombinase